MSDKTLKNYYILQVRSFIEYLPNLFYSDISPLKAEYAPIKEHLSFKEVKSLKFKAIQEGEEWGKNWDAAWFKLYGVIPKDWKKQCVVAVLNFGGEACVFSEDGMPLQGLTTMSAFDLSFKRDRFLLFKKCKGGEKIRLLVEAVAHDMIGALTRDMHPMPNRTYYEGFNARLVSAKLAVFNTELWHLWLDANTLFSLMSKLPEEDPQREQILLALLEASNKFNYSKPNPQFCRQILKRVLNIKADETRLTAIAVGHAHIDVEWLWPLRETIRKCARTFSSQLRLIEQYPDFIFGASQAQLYELTKNYYPALYQKIKEAVKRGRWEVQGAMWVEADCNIPSGESLVRQCLYGKKFFKEEFGIEIKNLWLPDVFGYSAALPQILRHMEVETFLTQKISWSQFNKFPYHTFIWKGIDGSSILAHFLPESNYNSTLLPDRQRFAAENFSEKGFLKEYLVTFGIGDGGGGATEEIIETGLRQRNLAGSSKIRFGKAEDFFKRLQSKKHVLKEWYGELYLELHRGTLTSQAKNKLFNRLCELTFQRVEKLFSALPAAQYPQNILEKLWKKALLFQFHDILPGSSIKEVYRDCKKEYEFILSELDTLEIKALNLISKQGTKKDCISVINTLSDAVRDVVRFDTTKNAASLQMEDGSLYPVQRLKTGEFLAGVEIGGLAAGHFEITDRKSHLSSKVSVSTVPLALENELVRYEFNDKGLLTRAYDKELNRDFIKKGERGNLLSLYQDWPIIFDAWDIELTYEEQLLEQASCEKVRIVEKGPVLGTIEFTYKIGSSKIIQNVSLAAFSKRLDFATGVFWNETRKMLRVAFPVDVFSDFATYEIQFGAYRRSTHRNTLWDIARFEVCAHRFADLSDEQGGVALLNNCKYGYKVYRRTLDLNLLRSPFYPDPTADKGLHHFIYSLLPHSANFANSNTVEEALLLNQKPIVYKGIINYEPPCRLESTSSVKIDTIKLSEDKTGWIARLYESKGLQSTVSLKIRENKMKFYEANGMEKVLQRDASNPENILFHPFELKTFLIKNS